MTINNWDLVAQFFPPEKIPELRELFARLMAKYDENTNHVLNDPEFDFAMNGNISCKLYAINTWQFDLEIKNRIAYYKNDGLDKILPNKMQVAQMYLTIAQKSLNPRDKILALAEYGKIMGFNDEETVQTGSTQNVILVTDNGSNMSWEEKLARNQFELQEKADKVLGLDEDEAVKH